MAIKQEKINDGVVVFVGKWSFYVSMFTGGIIVELIGLIFEVNVSSKLLDKIEKKAEKMSTKMIFVRHGQSEANKLSLWGGQKDFKLTETGRLQAKTVAKYISENYKIDAVYASTLSRSYDTAEETAKLFNLPVTKDKRLCEIYGAVWEGMSFDDIEKEYPEEFALWQGKEISATDYKKSGKETFSEIQQRGLKALEQIANDNPNKTVLIVTHRVFLRCLQCYWENRKIEDINKCEWVSNCSVSELNYESGKLIPVKIGYDGFLGQNVTQSHGKM